MAALLSGLERHTGERRAVRRFPRALLESYSVLTRVRTRFVDG